MLSNFRDGKGLLRDGRIYEARLVAAGFEVFRMDFTERWLHGRPVDLGIACEGVPVDAQWKAAKRWWWSPHPEHAAPAALVEVQRFERVLLKTEWIAGLFDWGSRAVVTGFESEDVGTGSFGRPVRVLHSRGRNSPVEKAWRIATRDRMVGDAVLVVSSGSAADSRLTQVEVIERRDEERWREVQRSCGVHVIASRHEGFSHTFWEGLSCGATVVATDGPWWASAAGAFDAVRATMRGKTYLAHQYHVESASLTKAIAAAVVRGMTYQVRARQAWERERDRFRAAFSGLLHEVRT